jgi:hypothetical protein
MTLTLFFWYFSWKFFVIQLISIILYVTITTILTEKRAEAFKE